MSCSRRRLSRTMVPTVCRYPERGEIDALATGVSAGLELFERAAAERSPARPLPPRSVLGRRAARARARRWPAGCGRCSNSDISLAAYHLPLDAHPSTRQQRAARRRAGGRGTRRPSSRSRDGRSACAAPSPAAGWPPTELVASDAMKPAVSRRCTSRAARTRCGRSASSRAVPPGRSAQRSRWGSTPILTGEPTEHVMAEALEGGVHFLAAGHYATETFGIRAPGRAPGTALRAAPIFVDIPNSGVHMRRSVVPIRAAR